MNVNLNSVEKVKEFVADVSRFEEDIDLVSGRFIVDAKSIMGIFSLDLSKPLILNVNGKNPERVMEELKKYS